MNKILVYHVKDAAAPSGRRMLTEIGDGMFPIDFPSNHELVAEIEVHSEGMRGLDEAYKLSQNIDQSWVLNKFVEVKRPDRERFRSTHIGDVLVNGSMSYVCAPIGWELLSSTDQKVSRG